MGKRVNQTVLVTATSDDVLVPVLVKQGEDLSDGHMRSSDLKGAKGDKGDKGNAGPVGTQGTQGPAGAQGDTGLQGPAGPTGGQGVQGEAGPTGSGFQILGTEDWPAIVGNFLSVAGDLYLLSEPHISAPIRSDGSAAQSGDGLTKTPTGDWENIGALRGPEGLPGNDGAQGNVGAQGAAGAQGNTGETGAQGIAGNDGIQGPAGPQGDPGIISDFSTIRRVTEAQFGALTPDPNTLYVVNG